MTDTTMSLKELDAKRKTAGLTENEKMVFYIKLFNQIWGVLNGVSHITQQNTSLKGWFKTLQAGTTAVSNPQKNDYFYVETDSTHTVQPYIYNGTIWEPLGEVVSTTDLTGYYTKTEADALFEPKVYDYSHSDITTQLNNTGGRRYQIIAMPAGADKTPIGVANKIKIHIPPDPTNIPLDGDQITYGSDLIWINKANTDIMTWAEIRNDVNAGSAMVIKKISDGNWELVKWETASNSSYMDDASMTDLENLAIATK